MTGLRSALYVLTLGSVSFIAQEAVADTTSKSALAGRSVVVELHNCTPFKTAYCVAWPTKETAQSSARHLRSVNASEYLEAESSSWYVVNPGQSAAVTIRIHPDAKYVGVYGEQYNDKLERSIADRITQIELGKSSPVWFFEASTDEPTVWWSRPDKEKASEQAGKWRVTRGGPSWGSQDVVPLKLLELPAGEEPARLHAVGTHEAATYVNETFSRDGTLSAQLAEAKKRAGLLRQAIFRQHAYYVASEKSRKAGFAPTDGGPPFRLGLMLNDENGPNHPGVRIKSVMAPYSIWGDRMPWKDGEWILAVNGTPVFGVHDTAAAVMHHAVTRGIKKPLLVDVASDNGETSRLTVTYRFEEGWVKKVLKPAQAIALAAQDEMMIGAGATGGEIASRLAGGLLNLATAVVSTIADRSYEPVYRPKLPFKQAVLLRENLLAMAAQVYKDEYKQGSFLGVLGPNPFSLGRGIIRRAAYRGTGSSVIARTASHAVVGGLGAYVTGYSHASPLLDAKGKRAVASEWATTAAAIDGLSGMLLSRGK